MYLTITPVDGGKPVLEEFDGIPDLARMQEIVGGLIEPIDLVSVGEIGQPGSRVVTAYCNEEGKILELPPTVAYVPMSDVLVGPLVVVAVNMEDGETASLTEEEVAAIKLGPMGLFTEIDGESWWIPELRYEAA